MKIACNQHRLLLEELLNWKFANVSKPVRELNYSKLKFGRINDEKIHKILEKNSILTQRISEMDLKVNALEKELQKSLELPSAKKNLQSKLSKMV